MRIMRPSRFAVVSLLVLLAIGCGINLYIAHVVVHLGTKPKVAKFHSTDWAQETIPNTPGSIGWPEIPAEIISTGRVPTSGSSAQGLLVDRFAVFIEDPEMYRLHRDDAGTEAPFLEPLILIESRYGAPFIMRSTSCTMTVQAWEGGAEASSDLITYHPLGLILNPIIYALPVWLLLMGVRWLLLARRSRRRERMGLCTGCGYRLEGLSVCPECGQGVACAHAMSSVCDSAIGSADLPVTRR